jgi:hypothetical protein
MRLSEAMREGAKRRPQGKQFYFKSGDIYSGGEPFSSCALGAAYEGCGGLASNLAVDVREKIAAVTGVDLHNTIVKIPFPPEPRTYGGRADSLFEAITTLNDRFEWTRERIADWLESIGF